MLCTIVYCKQWQQLASTPERPHAKIFIIEELLGYQLLCRLSDFLWTIVKRFLRAATMMTFIYVLRPVCSTQEYWGFL